VIPKARFVRVINTQGTNFGPQIGEIEVFGSLSDPPVIEPFEIIFVSAHPSSGNVELEFESVPGSTYAVYGSGNMTAWVLAESGITAVGDTATAEFMDINMLGASEYYYRVQLVP